MPLLVPDPPVLLDPGQALQTAYTRARYDLRVDYCQPPAVRLDPANAVWASERIAAPLPAT